MSLLFSSSPMDAEAVYGKEVHSKPLDGAPYRLLTYLSSTNTLVLSLS